ncbi:MAG: hypothetical protein ACRENO_06180 [Thermodesulfobacteriota bacterium]
MRNLLLTSVLALTFLAPGISFAGVKVFGVQVPVERQEVKGNILAGSYIAKDNSLTNTLVSQKLSNNKAIVSNDSEEKDAYYVFGVNIKAKKLI